VEQRHVPGADIYRQGLAAKAANDLEQAEHLFRQATHLNQELAEAWFELGRLKLQQAPPLAASDELKALQIFREGLLAEQEALRLLDAGKRALWTSEEETQARTTIDVDLRDAEQALGD
jgi:tetratricopeptide (TPR) repeat protein